jgi:acylphosphatase
MRARLSQALSTPRHSTPRPPISTHNHGRPSNVTRRFRVTGKVQGVYFRQSTRREAERLGVRGVARNLPDGSVEVIAQGAHPAVDALREWLKSGPSTARVAGVQEIETSPLDPPAASFSVE